MSIASEISRLQTAKAGLKTAIEGKGVTVPSATTLDGYPTLVSAIPSGGGGDDPELDVQNPMGTWLSELPDLSKLDRTSQVVYIVVDTSRAETPLYSKVWLRPQQAGTMDVGHLSNGSFVVDSTESTTASQYWEKELNKNGERFWILRFTSASNIVRIDPNGISASYQPIVAIYGYLPYMTNAAFINANENLMAIDVKGLKVLPAGSTKAVSVKYDDLTYALPVNAFYNNRNIREIDTTDWNIDSTVTLSGAFRACPNLKRIKFGTHDTSSVTTIQNMFNGSISLNHLDLSGLDLTGVTTTTDAFIGLVNLTDIDGWTAIPVSYSLYHVTNGSNYLTHDSLMKVINSLPTVQTTQTLTLGSPNLERLSAEEIAIATAKGWTVA